MREAKAHDAVTALLANRASHVGQGRIQSRQLSQGEPRLSGTQASVEAEIAQRASAFRDRMRAKGVQFTEVKVSLENVSLDRVDATTSMLRATEVTKIGYGQVRGGEPEFTSYTQRHLFTLSQSEDGSVTVVADAQLEPTGLLPLPEAEKFVDVVAAARELGNDTKSLPALPHSAQGQPTQDPAGGRSDAHVPWPAGVAVPAGASTTAGPKALRPKPGSTKPLAASANPLPTPTTTKPITDMWRKAMGEYAEKYWKDYNPQYRHWDGKGGDCTNFASQVLRVGGWADVPKTEPNPWWYQGEGQSLSWINVDGLAAFGLNTPGRFTNVHDVWDLQVGDILMVDKKRDADWEHSMPVSFEDGAGVPYLTYHSNNVYRRHLEVVLEDWPNTEFYPLDGLSWTPNPDGSRVRHGG